jgi:hypothetical protein
MWRGMQKMGQYAPGDGSALRVNAACLQDSERGGLITCFLKMGLWQGQRG